MITRPDQHGTDHLPGSHSATHDARADEDEDAEQAHQPRHVDVFGGEASIDDDEGEDRKDGDRGQSEKEARQERTAGWVGRRIAIAHRTGSRAGAAAGSAASRAGSTAITARRSASLKPSQPPISVSERPQPPQRPDTASMTQSLMQGVSTIAAARRFH